MSFSRGAIVASFGIVFFSLLIHKKYITLLKYFAYHLLFSFTFLFCGEELQYLIVDTLKFENTSSLGHLIEWIEGFYQF